VITSVTQLIDTVKDNLQNWDKECKPWFRGESGDHPALCPKISNYTHNQENYLLQSFHRQAGGLANVPPREHVDLWLFLAQHYGVPTRLLDWTEGALHALYFAISQDNSYPRVYMLNPRKLNELASSRTYSLNYPLSWIWGGGLYVSLAWQNRKLNEAAKEFQVKNKLDLDIPMAFPATYQDHRMIAQRSCFTIHGTMLEPIEDILRKKNITGSDCLYKYEIANKARIDLLKDLSLLGISAATIFPDLDHLAQDLVSDVSTFSQRDINEGISDIGLETLGEDETLRWIG
jgi:hypothetical protein